MDRGIIVEGLILITLKEVGSLTAVLVYSVAISIMQAGVTCTSFSNYTASKWQPQKKSHDLAPELAAYTLTQSLSYASHQCGRDYIYIYIYIYIYGNLDLENHTDTR